MKNYRQIITMSEHNKTALVLGGVVSLEVTWSNDSVRRILVRGVDLKYPEYGHSELK